MHPTSDTLALLALGEPAAPAAEQAHISGCAFCQDQIQELAHIVELGRSDQVIEALIPPPSRVWDRVHAEISASAGWVDGPAVTPLQARSTPRSPHSSEPLPPPIPAPVISSGLRTVRRSVLVLAAAVALLVGVGGGLAISRVLPDQPSAGSQVHLNALPGWAGSEGFAEVKQNAQGENVLVISVAPSHPTNGNLDVWLSDEKAEHMRLMGPLTNDAGTFVIPADMDLAGSPVVDISLEPTNDPEPAVHSGDSVVRGRLKR